MWFWIALLFVMTPTLLLNWLHHEFREQEFGPPLTYIIGVGTQTLFFAFYYVLRALYAPPPDPFHYLYMWFAIVAGTGIGNILVYFLDWLRDELKDKRANQGAVQILREQAKG